MTSTAGHEIRFDARRVRIPLMPIDAQRAYGEVFRRLWEFASTVRAAYEQGTDLARAMTDAAVTGLASTLHG